MTAGTPTPEAPDPVRAALAGPVPAVARLLLGAELSSHLVDGEVRVRLTEVEAYGGRLDPGSHAAAGWTRRNATMFGPPGQLYVYRHLGLHSCLNVVVGPPGEPAAVLLRSGRVVDGGDLAWARRAEAGVVRRAEDLARGPGRLAVALGLDLGWDGVDVLDPHGPVRLQLAEPVEDWSEGPRVGVSGEGGAVAFPWRYWLPQGPVSRYRAVPRTGAASRASAAPIVTGTAD